MEVYVDFSCKENSQTGRTKITVTDFDSTSIRDVKYAIQEAIQAPVCDQQLFYQGQRLTDDNMPLSRLYFREGDCLKVQFLAAANISGMREFLDTLKNSAHEIVEKFQRQLPNIDDGSSLWRRYDQLVHAVEELATFFFPWKSFKSMAQRHYFVQEGGFDAFLEVFKFSRQLYMTGDTENEFFGNEAAVELNTIQDQLKYHFNQGQLVLQLCCLSFLWNFGETPQDRRFLLSRNVFPLTVDALLLQPCPLLDTGHIDIASMIVGVNETAIGCCGGLVEFDSKTQEEVSKMPPLIDKLIFMIDRCKSEPAGYSLFSSQVASNTLFYVTFNVKSAQPLVYCGAVEKMINITRKLLIDNDGNTPLRYYCCLFLARMRSAPLVTLDRDTCAAIDELIDMFLSKHEPNEISKWEEEYSFVWMTMVPLVHLAFAAGKEYYCNKTSGITGNASQSDEACFLERKLLQADTTVVHEAGGTDMKESQSTCSKTLLSYHNGDGILPRQESCKRQKVVDNLSTETNQCLDSLVMHDTSDTMDIETLVSGNKTCVVTDNTAQCVFPGSSSRVIHDASEIMDIETLVSRDKTCVAADKNSKEQCVFPGSISTLKLGIFSVVHMLSIKENQQLALSENLLPYLVCLSWHLKCGEKEQIKNSLGDFYSFSAPPSLKVAAKSVLALVYGFDMVLKQ